MCAVSPFNFFLAPLPQFGLPLEPMLQAGWLEVLLGGLPAGIFLDLLCY